MSQVPWLHVEMETSSEAAVAAYWVPLSWGEPGQSACTLLQHRHLELWQAVKRRTHSSLGAKTRTRNIQQENPQGSSAIDVEILPAPSLGSLPRRHPLAA